MMSPLRKSPSATPVTTVFLNDGNRIGIQLRPAVGRKRSVAVVALRDEFESVA